MPLVDHHESWGLSSLSVWQLTRLIDGVAISLIVLGVDLINWYGEQSVPAHSPHIMCVCSLCVLFVCRRHWSMITISRVTFHWNNSLVMSSSARTELKLIQFKTVCLPSSLWAGIDHAAAEWQETCFHTSAGMSSSTPHHHHDCYIISAVPLYRYPSINLSDWELLFNLVLQSIDSAIYWLAR